MSNFMNDQLRKGRGTTVSTEEPEEPEGGSADGGAQGPPLGARRNPSEKMNKILRDVHKKE